MDVPVNWRDWVILVYVLLKLAQDWLILRGRISWPSPLAFFLLSHTQKMLLTGPSLSELG